MSRDPFRAAPTPSPPTASAQVLSTASAQRNDARVTERWREVTQGLAQTLHAWPWLETVRTLVRRFRQDRLGLTASSLAFTTLIALVPLVTVMLAIFSAFPMFAGFQLALEKYFVQNLVPATIAQPVMRAITAFSAKAGELGAAGFAFLLITALALMLTIDRTLNAMWRVRTPRRLAQRLLVYWAALTLGPLVVGVSLTFTTYLLSNTTRTTRSMSPVAEWVLQGTVFVIVVVGMAAMFRFVPNTHVRWRHALAGGLFVALGLQVAKRVLALYVGTTSLYTTVYGAFAAVPLLLLWIYVVWVIVLLGAVIAAYAPSLSMRLRPHDDGPGQRFTLALSIMRLLLQARGDETRGSRSHELAERLQSDPLLVESVVGTLMELNWVARLDEPGDPRLVSIVEPERTPVQALAERLLLGATSMNARFRDQAGWTTMRLSEVL